MLKFKKLSLIVFMLAAATQLNAQDKGSIRLNGGFAYGEGVEELGFNVGGEFFITNKLSGAPSLTYFFVEGGDVTQFNVDARYYLLKGPVQLYALGGYANFRVSTDLGGGFGRISVSDGGLNLGAGVVLPLGGKFGLHGQVKYATPADGQVLAQAGVTFRLK